MANEESKAAGFKAEELVDYGGEQAGSIQQARTKPTAKTKAKAQNIVKNTGAFGGPPRLSTPSPKTPSTPGAPRGSDEVIMKHLQDFGSSSRWTSPLPDPESPTPMRSVSLQIPDTPTAVTMTPSEAWTLESRSASTDDGKKLQAAAEIREAPSRAPNKRAREVEANVPVSSRPAAATSANRAHVTPTRPTATTVANNGSSSARRIVRQDPSAKENVHVHNGVVMTTPSRITTASRTSRDDLSSDSEASTIITDVDHLSPPRE